ncbi:Vacuolar amino acid transporter 1 [Melia azedarach]|uniref:Vacuolar amino acid transporter 1 n=2 Tax=Melia azedarach TaxID=155640 RepID=A0ACC1YBD0_MELAZ|nr:Vacuolar amino acid transporter 1 [Melia azedarach]KAJ4720738.1 Vacuolar amino acid transporter 1 [Melia azedarach]
MKNSASDHSLYIESEEEEDEEKVFGRNGGEEEDDNGNDSDSSAEIQQQNQPGSYNTSWPQSYRQSIDLYSSVPSPSLTFLGTPTLQRLSSSFLSSSLTRRHTPESLSSVTKPLLQTDQADEKQPHQQRRSSYALLPPIPPSRRSSSLIKASKSHVSHELPTSRNSSFTQAVLNGMNVLCGVGILSTPYAAKEGGWLGLSILIIFGVLSFYTGLLLRRCLDSEPGLQTYPDIGQAAFGTAGRLVISIILYVELYASCVEYIILEGDNLSSLFPNAHLSFCGFNLNSHHLFALMTTLAVLPTVWLRDLRVLSYISAGGVIASVLVVLCLFWVGLIDQVGFHTKGTTLNLTGLPVAIGLYGFCYSGHAVFPNIYTSMEKPNQFPKVLLTCFLICTSMYAGVAVMGYTMFGESTSSQFTLNMPQGLVASKIAVWTTVVNPFTKYALTISPVALSLEELIPSKHLRSHPHIYAICIRTVLTFSTLFVGLAIPFFGLVLSLIGSLLTMLVTLILPCACFLSILRAKVTWYQVVLCIFIAVVGIISSAIGTYSALFQIIEKLRS